MHKIKNRKILARNTFDEVTEPYELFELQEAAIIAVAHSYHSQWTGRNIGRRKQNLSIYQVDTLQLIAHIDILKYPVNHIDVDPQKQLLLIASGKYDGGYFFKGALYCYDLVAKRLIQIVEDNRSFSYCKFKGAQIEFKVGPPSDQDSAYLESSYLIPLDLEQVQKIEDFEPFEQKPYSDRRVIYKAKEQR